MSYTSYKTHELSKTPSTTIATSHAAAKHKAISSANSKVHHVNRPAIQYLRGLGTKEGAKQFFTKDIRRGVRGLMKEEKHKMLQDTLASGRDAAHFLHTVSPEDSRFGRAMGVTSAGFGAAHLASLHAHELFSKHNTIFKNGIKAHKAIFG